jgi:DNA-binding transcriptional MerR regulator
MFKIGDFSKLTRVSVRMLRYYDETGLLTPCKVDEFTNYRYYSAKQIEALNLIVSLRDFGFNVSEIAAVIAAQSNEKQKEMLRRKRDEIEKDIAVSNQRLKRLDSVIKNIDKEKITMSYNVKTKQVPSYNVVSYRQKIPSYSAEGMLWAKLGEYMAEKGLNTEAYCYATYHDKEYKEGDVDVEVVMEVDKLLDNERGFVYKKTEPIEQAAYVLVPGDYSNIGPAFNFLGKWIEDNGYEICGLVRQLCIKGPWNEENTENYLTELQIPIKKA